ncbi:Ger(x)C family spore germination protein [Bacillus sp. JRC01]|nr:Ger(x)C family spore germination protein [Bacillus sp. JRC01]
MRKVVVLIFIISQLFLSGCWDQRLLKSSRLVYSTAFDLGGNDSMVEGTVIIRDFKGGVPTNLEVNAEGYSIRDLRINLENRISGNLEQSKNQVYLLGEDLAKEDIYDFMDIFFRDPQNSISSKIAVTKGTAGDYLRKLSMNNVLISEFIIESIASSESQSKVPKVNMQTICTVMFDEGKDFMLPLFKMKEQEIIQDGTALFSGRRMTGELTDEESTILLIMTKQEGKVARFVSKVNADKEPNIQNYISYNLMNTKVKMRILSNTPGNIRVGLHLKADIDVAEYPPNQLFTKKEIKRLNKEIVGDLTSRIEDSIKKIQEANSDLFGVGRELIAFHPKEWNRMNWREEYPTIHFETNVQAEITGNGIIN